MIMKKVTNIEKKSCYCTKILLSSGPPPVKAMQCHPVRFFHINNVERQMAGLRKESNIDVYKERQSPPKEYISSC